MCGRQYIIKKIKIKIKTQTNTTSLPVDILIAHHAIFDPF
jgi:hypothetical protein